LCFLVRYIYEVVIARAKEMFRKMLIVSFPILQSPMLHYPYLEPPPSAQNNPGDKFSMMKVTDLLFLTYAPSASATAVK
jgi:hypothetical protein